jgi:hypothetical protein
MTRAHSPPPTASDALAPPAKKRYKGRGKEESSAVSAPSSQTANMASSSPARPEEDLFQRALDFLTDNEPEQCLRVQLPFQKYEELQRHAESLYSEKK